jgi:hypothetical protein
MTYNIRILTGHLNFLKTPNDFRNKSISYVVSVKYFIGGFAKKACP